MRTYLVCIPLILASTAAWAFDDGDHKAAQATIERQIEAFRKSDTATAYAQAAPEIQTMFDSPETFRAMVELGYKPVLNPRRYSFDKVEDTGETEIAQGVTLQDQDGVDWMALYLLQKQSDGQWRITGCTLKKAPGDNA